MTEPRIWILPSEVAEQIAAGEVVERPASVVKELVENALDAGARRITVETEAGGKALIRITDDGCGMTADEARLALHRHATSKLRSADDLFNIHTLGFRGEALPSIAAVSHLEILSRTPDSPEGTRLTVEGGIVTRQEPAAAQVGTTLTVQRLFFNVPVREKFLRSDTSEATHITEWLQRLALSRGDVSFRLTHDGREALLSPGSQDPLNAVVAVLGRPVAREMLRIPTNPNEGHSIRVSGFVSRPTLTRANRALQHTYVNGRAVRSPLFYRALDDAFRASMPQGRHPAAVLFIQVPPDQVDVNVHPAKTEVRFRDEWAVHGAVLEAARAALRAEGVAPAPAATLLPETPRGEAPPSSASRVAEPGVPLPETTPFADAALGGAAPTWSPYSRPALSREPGYHWTPPREYTSPPPADEPPGSAAEPGGAPSVFPLQPAPELEPSAAPPLPPPVTYTQPEPPPTESVLGELRLLGQAQDLYILAEGGGQFWVIDQHVAHERVLFDRMTASDRVAEASDPLLIPASLQVDRAQSLALAEHADLLAELGFNVEPFGPGTYALRAVPRSLAGRNYETVFRDLVDELTEQSKGGQIRLRREELAMVAAGRSCKSAIKAGRRLTPRDMEWLLGELAKARNPYTCPHGRPVFLTFAPEEISRLFGPNCE